MIKSKKAESMKKVRGLRSVEETKKELLDRSKKDQKLSDEREQGLKKAIAQALKKK